MNTRDIGQHKAFELLQEMGLDPATHIAGSTLLSVATIAFLQGWVYGISDARSVVNDEQIRAGFANLRRLLNMSTTPIMGPKS